MANVTDPMAAQKHGMNPQNLVALILRTRIYSNQYWKEKCFGLTAESLLDMAVKLEYVGGTYSHNAKPTPFICLVLKLLQIQPEKEIIVEYIKNEDYKYVRALGAFYMRLVGRPADVYQYLEPLYNDYRKIAVRGLGGWELSHMDEFVDSLLTGEVSCDVTLPHLPKRDVLEANGHLPPRVSALEDDLNEEEEEEPVAPAAEQARKGPQHIEPRNGAAVGTNGGQLTASTATATTASSGRGAAEADDGGGSDDDYGRDAREAPPLPAVPAPPLPPPPAPPAGPVARRDGDHRDVDGPTRGAGPSRAPPLPQQRLRSRSRSNSLDRRDHDRGRGGGGDRDRLPPSRQPLPPQQRHPQAPRRSRSRSGSRSRSRSLPRRDPRPPLSPPASRRPPPPPRDVEGGARRAGRGDDGDGGDQRPVVRAGRGASSPRTTTLLPRHQPP